MKKIIAIAIIGIFLFASFSAVGMKSKIITSENSNSMKKNDDSNIDPPKISRTFYFCKIESNGWGYCPINGMITEIRFNSSKSDGESLPSTVIYSLFGLDKITIEGDHIIKMIFPRITRSQLSEEHGDCLLVCRAPIVTVIHN